MKLNWFRHRLKFKARSPKRRRALRGAGGVFVPRLEPLEDRSLPSSYPTVTLSDGTVVQLVPASNSSSAFFASVTPVAVTTNVDWASSAFLGSFGLVDVYSVDSARIIQATGSFSFSPQYGTNSLNLDVGLIVSRGPSGVTVLDAVHNVATVLSLSPTANGNQSAATSYAITIRTVVGSQNISQDYNITALDANGRETNGFTSDIQVANPSTNSLQLPGPTNGQTNFVLNILLDWSGGSFANIVGLCGGCFGDSPLPLDNGTLFPATGDPLDNPGLMKFTFTITNPNSLALADTGLNIWLSHTIIQDAGFRASSASAQVTWQGMRGPPELPLAHAERGKATDFWTNLIKDQSEKDPIGSSLEKRFPVEPTAHSRPMEAMVREILSSLPQAKRDEKDDVTALLPPSNADEKTRHQKTNASEVVRWWRGDGSLSLPIPHLSTSPLHNGLVSLPASRKDAEFALPMMRLDPANNEGFETALDEEGLSNGSRFAKAPLWLPVAHSKWIGWLEGVGGFLLMVGGPVALWDNLTSAKGESPEDNDTLPRPSLRS